MLTPEEMQKKIFALGSRIENNEIGVFIKEVQVNYQYLFNELKEHKQDIKGMEAKLNHYRAVEASLQDAMISAEKMSKEKLKEAEHSAREIEKKAYLKADEIVRDAEQELKDLKNKIEEFKKVYTGYQDRYKNFVKGQLSFIDEAKKIVENEEIDDVTTSEDDDSYNNKLEKSEYNNSEISDENLANSFGVFENNDDVSEVQECERENLDDGVEFLKEENDNKDNSFNDLYKSEYEEYDDFLQDSNHDDKNQEQSINSITDNIDDDSNNIQNESINENDEVEFENSEINFENEDLEDDIVNEIDETDFEDLVNEIDNSDVNIKEESVFEMKESGLEDISIEQQNKDLFMNKNEEAYDSDDEFEEIDEDLFGGLNDDIGFMEDKTNSANEDDTNNISDDMFASINKTNDITDDMFNNSNDSNNNMIDDSIEVNFEKSFGNSIEQELLNQQEVSSELDNSDIKLNNDSLLEAMMNSSAQPEPEQQLLNNETNVGISPDLSINNNLDLINISQPLYKKNKSNDKNEDLLRSLNLTPKNEKKNSFNDFHMNLSDDLLASNMKMMENNNMIVDDYNNAGLNNGMQVNNGMEPNIKDVVDIKPESNVYMTNTNVDTLNREVVSLEQPTTITRQGEPTVYRGRGQVPMNGQRQLPPQDQRQLQSNGFNPRYM